MPWKPREPGEFPTLGWYALDWIEENLAQPDTTEYQPLVLTQEQARFLLQFYRLDPMTGRRKYRRGVWSRPKGHGKSPLMGAVACLEALADIVPDGWDADGRPIGRPWSSVRTPWVQLAAVSEDQTRNAYGPLLEMIRQGPVLDRYGVDPMETFVALEKGRIEFVTSSATSREGNRPVWCGLDQTEEWRPSNGGVRLASVLRRNLGKVGGSSIESPNAFLPGEGSVAEASASYAASIREGRAMDEGLLFDHREAPADTDMSDRESLLKGLAYAYGDSAQSAGGWVDLDRIVQEVWDPGTDPQDARRFYLNQITHASDSWLSQPEWAGCADASKVVADRDLITLGFDGSRSRNRGTADATALVGCRVSDGHLFEIEVWEQPRNWPTQGEPWQVPVALVDAKVREAFAKYRVAAFYADPAKWESYIASWEAAFGAGLQVKSTRDHPVEWWMTGGRARATVQALEQFSGAVLESSGKDSAQRELTHDGSSTLTRHVLNARRRMSRSGVQIAKAHPDSADKIDAAVAAVLAWQARLDCVAAGVGRTTERRYAPRRIR